jgi:hypothetical protein
MCLIDFIFMFSFSFLLWRSALDGDEAVVIEFLLATAQKGHQPGTKKTVKTTVSSTYRSTLPHQPKLYKRPFTLHCAKETYNETKRKGWSIVEVRLNVRM